MTSLSKTSKLTLNLSLLSAASAISALISPFAQADILPEGMKYFRQDVFYHTASGIWAGSSNTPFSSGTQSLQLGTNASYSFNVGKRYQADFSLAVAASQMSGGSFGGRNGGERISGLSGVGARITREIRSSLDNEGKGTGLNMTLGITHPGTRAGKGNDFIALNDGVTRLTAGMAAFFRGESWYAQTDATYAFRTGNPPDQLIANTSFNYLFSDRFSAGPLASVVYSLGGLEMGTPAFTTAGSPFSEVKEFHVGAGATGSYSLSSTHSVSLTVHKKVAGKNTDQGTTFSVGLGIVL